MTFYIFLVFTLLWFLFMTFLSHQDGEHTGKASRELAKHLRFLDGDVNDLNGKLRHVAHIVVFAVLTILLGLTIYSGGLPIWLHVIVFVLSYVDEATKPWIRGRHFSWFDVGLNLIGVGMGWMIMFFVNNIVQCVFI